MGWLKKSPQRILLFPTLLPLSLELVMMVGVVYFIILCACLVLLTCIFCDFLASTGDFPRRSASLFCCSFLTLIVPVLALEKPQTPSCILGRWPQFPSICLFSCWVLDRSGWFCLCCLFCCGLDVLFFHLRYWGLRESLLAWLFKRLKSWFSFYSVFSKCCSWLMPCRMVLLVSLLLLLACWNYQDVLVRDCLFL